MDFYLTYAALRHAIVMARVKRRMIHFREDQVPGDPDDYVLHRASPEKLLAGTYRWDLDGGRFLSTSIRVTRRRCRWTAWLPATATSTTAAISTRTSVPAGSRW